MCPGNIFPVMSTAPRLRQDVIYGRAILKWNFTILTPSLGRKGNATKPAFNWKSNFAGTGE